MKPKQIIFINTFVLGDLEDKIIDYNNQGYLLYEIPTVYFNPKFQETMYFAMMTFDDSKYGNDKYNNYVKEKDNQR
jgi:hypothetical protein